MRWCMLLALWASDPWAQTATAKVSRLSSQAALPGAGRRQARHGVSLAIVLAMSVVVGLAGAADARAAQLLAGVARADITDRKAGPVHDPLYAKALVLRNDTTTVAIITVDAVAIGEIGPIGNDYLGKVRARLEKELHIPPTHVLVNASHCHGVVCSDVAERTFQAVEEAARNLVPVTVGAGTGHEDRIMENRRLKLRDGREVDVRHAYSLPPDETVAAVGPVDPEIGVLRLDRTDGRALAVVYNFACHPIQGVPGGGNTADLTGFASRTIEESLGAGTIALFLQGCAGDINPVGYKDVAHPRDAEPLGTRLGLSTLIALRKVKTREDGRLKVLHQVLSLPTADLAEPIAALEAERERLVSSLKGTTLNLKSFVQLLVKYNLASDFPSAHAYRYSHERALGRKDLDHLDAENRRNIEHYLQNVYTMEQLTRVQTNLALLRKHQARRLASGRGAIDVELLGLRIGDLVLVTFPGELSVQIGLNIKKASPHERTFVAAYTNGYIYYAPTAEQLRNVGGAQEDSDCLLAPPWQALFEAKVAEILRKL